MKNLIAALLVTLALVYLAASAWPRPLQAQGPSPDPMRAYKIGIVDLQRVMDSYEKRVIEVRKLEKEATEYKEKLDALQESFQKELETFDANKPDMSEDQRADRELELSTRALDVQSEVRQAEALLEGKRRRMKKSLLKGIVTAVEQVGAAGNYHLILEADPESRTGVLYHTPGLNMTQKVIDRLNS